jgi:hypothetical protein
MIYFNNEKYFLLISVIIKYCLNEIPIMFKRLFIRESSGLVRQMGAKHAFAKVLALIAPVSVYYTLIYSPSVPAANWTIGIILAPLLALPIFLTYLKLAEYIPRETVGRIERMG